MKSTNIKSVFTLKYLRIQFNKCKKFKKIAFPFCLFGIAWEIICVQKCKPSLGIIVFHFFISHISKFFSITQVIYNFWISLEFFLLILFFGVMVILVEQEGFFCNEKVLIRFFKFTDSSKPKTWLDFVTWKFLFVTTFFF